MLTSERRAPPIPRFSQCAQYCAHFGVLVVAARSRITSPAVHLQSSDGLYRTTVVYKNGDTEILALTTKASGLFQLEESSILGHASDHDIIRGTFDQNGALRFEGLAEASGYCTLSCIFSNALIESDEFQSVLSSVVSVGGNWERIFGGVFLLYLPPLYADEFKTRL